MAKEALKERVVEKKGNVCALSGARLPSDKSLFDTHRRVPKRKKGVYSIDNTDIVCPIAHQVEHGTYRERTEELNALKTMVDDRNNLIKFKNKISNQLLAYSRGTDISDAEMVENLTSLKEKLVSEVGKKTRLIEKLVIRMDNQLAKAALGVRSIGPITVAYCLVYIDLEKARHASCLWSYTGLHKASHERYKKGESSGGNKTLRTVLYTMADSQIKGRGPYRVVYDNVKARLEKSERIVKTRNTKGDLIECAWKDTKPSHRHGAAMRAIMKHFLADYWMVGRTLAGLDTSPIYAEAELGMTHKTIAPEDRGWVY